MRQRVPMPVAAGLGSPALPARHETRRLLDAALRRRGIEGERRAVAAPWGAEHFGLLRASAFGALNAEGRRAALAECGRGLLEEAYFIEKLGLAFAAKMSLLAQSTEERAAHCLFAADEAVHLARVGAFLPEAPDSTDDGFLRWLAGVVEDMPPQGARLLVQVLLEGWGISHYRALSRSCRDAALAQVLGGIAADEVLHHRAGVTLFDARRLRGEERRRARARVGELFAMVGAGPVRVALAVERAHGGLGRAGRARLMSELEAPRHAAERLALLRRLLAGAGAESLAPA